MHLEIISNGRPIKVLNGRIDISKSKSLNDTKISPELPAQNKTKKHLEKVIVILQLWGGEAILISANHLKSSWIHFSNNLRIYSIDLPNKFS